jgi:hypothetical protein
MTLSAAVLLASVLGAVPALGLPESSYVALSSDKALDCIESWEQLCSVPPGPYFNVTIHEDRVEVAPYMDGGATFRIIKRGAGMLELVFGRCEDGTCPEGEGATARLTAKSNGEAAWDGADVSQIIGSPSPLMGREPHIS